MTKTGRWSKVHSYVVQECLAISPYCYLCRTFEDDLPDYLKLVEKPAGACRKRFYLVCPSCGCFRTHLFLPPTADAVWKCRKCHGLIYSSQRYGRKHPLRLTPPPRFYAKRTQGRLLPHEYDLTPMMKPERKRRYGLPDLRELDVLFQKFERNMFGIAVRRL